MTKQEIIESFTLLCAQIGELEYKKLTIMDQIRQLDSKMAFILEMEQSEQAKKKNLKQKDEK